MKIRNLQVFKGLPFEDYKALPGLSHSAIKSDGAVFTATPAMQLGTKVHNYLLEPHKYDHSDIETVRPLAVALKKRVGDVLMQRMEPELSVTCEMHHNGMKLQYKGRLDMSAMNVLVVDFKVTKMPIHKGVEHFGYDNQQSGYALATGARAAIIMAINPTTKAIQVFNVPIRTDWWEYQIVKHGTPI